MEHGPFIDDFPIKTSIYGWDFPWQTVGHNQMVMFSTGEFLAATSERPGMIRMDFCSRNICSWGINI
jgi:hypothetical protein